MGDGYNAAMMGDTAVFTTTSPANPTGASRGQGHGRLAALLLLFAGLALLYNAAVPLFEAPDEMDHVRYAHWLAEGNGLPHLEADRQQVGEIWQPPLYYALIAAVIAPIDRSDLATVAPLNRQWPRSGAPIAHFHTTAEQFPYRQTSLAVHLARFVSTLLGMVTIICTYGTARLIAPRYALTAAALVALTPQFVFMSTAVNNDNLVIALCSLVIWWLVWQWQRPLRRPPLPWWQYALVGLVWGAAVLAKLTGAALGGVLAVGLGLAAWRAKSWRPLAGGMLAGLTAVLVCGWWFGRNWQLYGDPLAWQQMLAVTQGIVRPQPLTGAETAIYASFLRKTYWAMFGYGVPAPESFYWFAQAVMLLALIGWGRRLVQAAHPLRPSPVWLLWLWSGTVLLLLLRWMQQIDTTNQGRLLYPAISSLAVLLVLGLAALDGRRRWLSRAVVVLLGVWTAALPFLAIQPAYARPTPLPDTAVIPQPAAVRFGEHVELLGFDLPAGASPQSPLPVTLYWQASRPLPDNYVIAVRILDADQRVVSSLDTLPYQGRFPTPVWPAGQPFADEVTLPPLAAGAAAGGGTLLVIVYPLGQPDQPLPVTVAGNPAGFEARLGRIRLETAVPTVVTPPLPLPAQFGSQFRLVGMEPLPPLTATRPVTVTFIWEAVQPDGRDYTVFVHLADAAGNVVAQADGPPQNNRYPTALWAAGEQIRDPHLLHLPADLPPGTYTLTAGWYDPATGQRLPAIAAGGARYADDAVPLPVTVDIP